MRRKIPFKICGDGCRQTFTPLVKRAGRLHHPRKPDVVMDLVDQADGVGRDQARQIYEVQAIEGLEPEIRHEQIGLRV